MSAEEILKSHFKNLDIPDTAGEWLLGVWRITQFFDDVADGDKVVRKDLDVALLDSLIFHANSPFFIQYREPLSLALATFIAKWQASDTFERTGGADARSYMWRAGYYDLILSVVALVHGAHSAGQIAPSVLSLYGESFEDYQKEFSNG